MSVAKSVAGKAKLMMERFFFSPMTTAYFVFTIIHCIVQIILQAEAFASNASAENNLFSLLMQANDGKEIDGFAVLGNDLRICYTVPSNLKTDSCEVIWAPPTNSTASMSPGIAAVDPQSTASALYDSEPSVISTAPSSTATGFTTIFTTVVPPTPSLTSTHPAVTTTTTVIVKPTSSSPAATQTVVASSPSGTKQATVVVANNEAEDDGDHPHSNNVDALQQLVNGLTSHREVQRREIEVERNTSATGQLLGVTVQGLQVTGTSNNSIQLSDVCIQTLIWPAQQLSNTKREDITLMGFQIWVLGMSLVALLNESIPHIVASLLTQLLVTAWSIAQIFETEEFRWNFFRLTVSGACKPVNLLGSYWQHRKNAEIASAVLNGVSLLIAAFFSWRLTKTFGWQTFQRIGASVVINRVYKLVLTLSINIQLALFFVVATAGLWIDQLYNGAVGRWASLAALYKAGAIIMFVLLGPWLALGWFSVRREMRKRFLVFLFLSFVFLGLWGGMFDSTSFRWTFILWPFFAVMTVVSGTLIVSTLILGVACRLNFGKGLPRYLNAMTPLGDDNSDMRSPYPDFEKVVPFPTSTDPYHVSFPVSYNSHSESGHGTVSPTSLESGADLSRSNSQSTQSSGSSYSLEQGEMKQKRWVID